MIKLLNSNYEPLNTNSQTFENVFFESLHNAAKIKIASGYISGDSIAELLGLYSNGFSTELCLVVGMHFFEGFSRVQYEALLSLSDILENKKCGGIFISRVSKYHGKIYSFCNKKNEYSAIIGSSNLTKINTFEKIYDTDIYIKNEKINSEIDNFISELIGNYCDNIKNLNTSDIKFIEPNNLFENYEDVIKIGNFEKKEIENSLIKDISFEIEIKPEEKTHLNCYFGKGRENPFSKIIVPRPWYEANIIVSNKITNDKNYPKKEEKFNVITDDGYKFICVVNGDNAKNLRTVKDLQILGKWLKGRLENSNSLKIGEKVTSETLSKYGRNNFTMTKTNIPNTWYFNFGVNYE